MAEFVEFGEAASAMRDGFRVTREGWKEKGIYVFLVNYRSVEYYLQNDEFRTINHRTRATIAPHFVIHTEDGQLMPYTFTPADILTWDWLVLDQISNVRWFNEPEDELPF